MYNRNSIHILTSDIYQCMIIPILINILLRRYAPASDQWPPPLLKKPSPGSVPFYRCLLWAAVNSWVTKHNVLTRHNISHYMETRVATSWSSNPRETKMEWKFALYCSLHLPQKIKKWRTQCSVSTLDILWLTITIFLGSLSIKCVKIIME